MTKFIVDESSGEKLATFLLQQGYDVIYAGDKFKGASDIEILKIAEKEKRIIITNDKDFGESIYRYKELSYGVIFLRPRLDKPYNRIKLVMGVIEKYGEELKKRFIIVSEDRIRVKRI